MGGESLFFYVKQGHQQEKDRGTFADVSKMMAIAVCGTPLVSSIGDAEVLLMDIPTGENNTTVFQGPCGDRGGKGTTPDSSSTEPRCGVEGRG